MLICCDHLQYCSLAAFDQLCFCVTYCHSRAMSSVPCMSPDVSSGWSSLLMLPNTGIFWEEPMEKWWLLIAQPVFSVLWPEGSCVAPGHCISNQRQPPQRATEEHLGQKAADSFTHQVAANNQYANIAQGRWIFTIRTQAPCGSQHSSGRHSCSWGTSVLLEHHGGSRAAQLPPKEMCSPVHASAHTPPSISKRAENPARIPTKPFCYCE